MKRYPVSRILAAIVWAIPFLSFGASPSGEFSRPPDTTFLTDGFGVTTVDFIPESLLKSGEWKKLPLHPMTADATRQAVEYSRKQIAAGKVPCTDGVEGAVPAGAGEPLREGVDALKASRIVIVGTVEHLVHGLDADGDAATLVKVYVMKALKDGGAVHVGDRVSFMELIGKTMIDGVEVCTGKRGYRLPSEGEDVVVGGILDPDNPGDLIAGWHRVFFVRDGIVRRGATMPENWRPIALKDLEESLNPGMSH